MSGKALDSKQQAIQVWTGVIMRVLLIVAGVLVAAYLLYIVRTTLFLIAVAVLFAYVLAPIVRLLERPVHFKDRTFQLSRGFAILVLYISLGAVIILLGRILVPVVGRQLSALGQNLPGYVTDGLQMAQRGLATADQWLAAHGLPDQAEDLFRKEINDANENLAPRLKDIVIAGLSSLAYIPWLILVPILAFFMLKDVDRFQVWLLELFPTQKLQRRAHRLLVDISNTLAGYIRAQITSCIVVGATTMLGFAIIGIDYAVVMGILCGALEFIPLLGPAVAMSIVTLLALLTSAKKAFVVLSFLLTLRVVQDYILYPRIVGHEIKMHPLVLIVAVLGAAEIDGIRGVFLATPIVGLLIVGLNHYLAHRKALILGKDTGELIMPE